MAEKSTRQWRATVLHLRGSCDCPHPQSSGYNLIRVESGQHKTFEEKYGQRVPLGHMDRREEIVGAVVNLTFEAASYLAASTRSSTVHCRRGEVL